MHIKKLQPDSIEPTDVLTEGPGEGYLKIPNNANNIRFKIYTCFFFKKNCVAIFQLELRITHGPYHSLHHSIDSFLFLYTENCTD